MYHQVHVHLNSRDDGEEGIDDKLGIAEIAQVELWRSQLQRTQHGLDEARARGGPLGLTTHERKATGRTDGQIGYRLDVCQPFQPRSLQPCPRIRYVHTVLCKAAGLWKYSRANRRASLVPTAAAPEERDRQVQACPGH